MRPLSMNTTRLRDVAGKAHFMGDDQHGRAFAGSDLMVFSTSPTSSGSSAEVISSSSTSLGSMASARAMATRCCWPPDKLAGIDARRGQRGRRGSSQFMRSVPGPRRLAICRTFVSPSMTLPSAVRCGKQVEALEHHAGHGALARQLALAQAAAGAACHRLS